MEKKDQPEWMSDMVARENHGHLSLEDQKPVKNEWAIDDVEQSENAFLRQGRFSDAVKCALLG
jgi:hypothetical protein